MIETQATPGPAAVSPAPTFPALPRLCAVEEIASAFPHARLTPAAVRALVFRADDRHNSRGELLPGNGLGRAGAIVRIGRKVLIDLDRFAAWVESHRGQPCSN
jgi:hypothetical protein